ncbi:hypothetical protein JVT61DRAFT_10771 [Boletus reticuloceps]|uniref:Uncharacterized protein n=1 Tax=Boletus reticuloceps TaxID=495285 RepID=A0A8I2YF91_9AGAM|nr:hypothetical protein JVT61DRAFT_10771 [Boletus reticuloceps]
MSVAESVAEGFTAPSSPGGERSPHIQTFNCSELCHSRHGCSLGKRMFNFYSAFPRPDGAHTSPRCIKRQKTAKTSFDNGRDCEVRDHMNKQMLDLARMTREVYVARMQYQRLRMQELEMIKLVMREELEELGGYLNQMECQVG